LFCRYGLVYLQQNDNNNSSYSTTAASWPLEEVFFRLIWVWICLFPEEKTFRIILNSVKLVTRALKSFTYWMCHRLFFSLFWPLLKAESFLEAGGTLLNLACNYIQSTITIIALNLWNALEKSWFLSLFWPLLGSISSTFYVQLIHAQSPKA